MTVVFGDDRVVVVTQKDTVVVTEFVGPAVVVADRGVQGPKGDTGAGSVVSVGATDSTITVSGTATAPTVAVNAIAESQVTGLPADLTGIATSLTTKVASSDSRLSDARTPTAHKTTHATGGTDALSPSDIGAATTAHNHAGTDVTTGTVAYARLPVGTAASTVAAGDDSRMTNARTPTAHKTTHAAGGTDALSPSDIGAATTAHSHAGADVTSGTVGYARLPVGATASTVAAGDDSRLSDARTPTAHSHAGADVTSGTVAYARLPVGTAASTVAAGDDSRLSDARTPTAHKSTHATGGTDALTPADIGAQSLDSDLTAIAAETATTDNILQSVAGAWKSRTPTQVKAALAIAESDVSGLVADLGILLRQMASGLYYYTASQHTSTTNATGGNGTLRLVPWIVPKAITITKLGAEVTVVGESGSKVRLGIYNDNGSCYPGTLLLDAGQIAGDSATVQELTVSQAIPAGIYWVGGAIQSAPTTSPTLRVTSNWNPPVLVAIGSSIPAGGGSSVGYSQTGVTAALPGTFSATVANVGNAVRTFVKA